MKRSERINCTIGCFHSGLMPLHAGCVAEVLLQIAGMLGCWDCRLDACCRCLLQIGCMLQISGVAAIRERRKQFKGAPLGHLRARALHSCKGACMPSPVTHPVPPPPQHVHLLPVAALGWLLLLKCVCVYVCVCVRVCVYSIHTRRISLALQRTHAGAGSAEAAS